MPHFTTSDGLSLQYIDHGTGLPILCLAGLTRCGRDFDFVAPYLSNYRLIRLDYRGRGGSDWARDAADYSVPRESTDVLELLDHLNLERVAILGTSRGGLNAMYLAATAHDRLLGVALNDVGPKLEKSGLDLICDYIGRRPNAKTFQQAAELRAKTAKGFDSVPLSRWLEEAERLYTQQPDGLHLRYDPKLRDAFMAAFDGGDLPTAWPLFDALDGLPIALIHGDTSDLLSHDTVLDMKRRRPDMVLARVPDRGHIPFLDEPQAVAAIQEWIGLIQNDTRTLD